MYAGRPYRTESQTVAMLNAKLPENPTKPAVAVAMIEAEKLEKEVESVLASGESDTTKLSKLAGIFKRVFGKAIVSAAVPDTASSIKQSDSPAITG